jgi:hypothetical protein
MLQVQTVSHLVYIELLYIYKTTHSVKTQNIANVRIWRKTKTSVTVRAWAIFPWGIANLTLYIEWETQLGKTGTSTTVTPYSQITIFKQMCMSAACYSSEYQMNGVKACAVWENQYAYRRVISLSQNTSLCSYISMSFSFHGMPLWHTFPNNVCNFMSVTTDNPMVIYPWECNRTIQVLCEENLFFLATQIEVCSITACNQSTNQPNLLPSSTSCWWIHAQWQKSIFCDVPKDGEQALLTGETETNTTACKMGHPTVRQPTACWNPKQYQY